MRSRVSSAEARTQYRSTDGHAIIIYTGKWKLGPGTMASVVRAMAVEGVRDNTHVTPITRLGRSLLVLKRLIGYH
jgi:hypothetical protein